jgi:hypothetical protein
MKKMTIAKTIALVSLFGLLALRAPAQTPQQLAEAKSISEKDWTDTLDYCGWLLDAQFWIDHADSEYAKQFFAELNLSATDEAAFRTIVVDFNKRHDLLMAEEYVKLTRAEWTPETQTKLTKDLIDATNDTIERIKTDLSPEGMKNIQNAFL